MRGLAVTSEARHPQVPELPTMVKAASPTSSRCRSPASSPPPAVVARLNAVINDTLKAPEIAATLIKLAVDAKSETSGEFTSFLVKELERLAPVVKSAGIVGE